ncbi:hypothetical protein [Dyella japonica]|uniref:Uncharacterized protein n=1 Tax=Dyella japonica DSM 16301 TaxID=1440762 RepID=A0A0G9H854_9GAMM|nr:hypothetical protein Y882_00935 [Dyella japonica DSM 16301]
MAYKSARRVDMGAVALAPFAALQWRLLLLWLLATLIATMVAALPLLQSLGALLDRSTHTHEWARHFDGLMFSDVAVALSREHATLHGAGLASALLMLLWLPWLNGMVVASGRAGRTLGFAQLLQGGLIEYGRMFRLMLCSVLPYALAGLLVQMGLDRADDRGDLATLQSQADNAQQVAWWAAGIVIVLAQAWVESARASFIADVGLRSASIAMLRGLLQLLRRPVSTLFVYLLLTAVGFAIALALGLARVHTVSVGTSGLLWGFTLTQLIVVALGWMRIARLFALADVGRSLGMGRRSGL